MRALVEMEGSGLVPLLEGDKYEDLARMYSLLRQALSTCTRLAAVLLLHSKYNCGFKTAKISRSGNYDMLCLRSTDPQSVQQGRWSGSRM